MLVPLRPGEVGTMVGEVFGIDSAIVILILLAPLALAIYCTVDVAKQQAMTTSQKAGWIIGFLAGWFFFEIVGLIVAIVYLVSVRPKLRP